MSVDVVTNAGVFTSFTGGYGTVVCTVPALPLRLLPVSGCRGNRTLPFHYKFVWAWQRKTIEVHGNVGADKQGFATLHLKCKNTMPGKQLADVKITARNPSEAVTALLCELCLDVAWGVSEQTKINAWNVIGLSKDSACSAYIKQSPSQVGASFHVTTPPKPYVFSAF